MKKLYSDYEQKLNDQRAAFNYRSLSPLEICGKYVIKDGRKLLNLSSNDYLGISCRDDIRREFLKSYNLPLDIPSARLLCANSSCYFELEDYLKTLFKKDSALLFNSGYHANVGIYSTLAGKGDAVFCDKLNHASIIDGIRLGGADIIPYKHCDYDDLKNKLSHYRSKYKTAIIASEALFSMDGDFADIKILAQLKEQFEAMLVIDEAHSFGVYGEGLGWCAQSGQLDRVDLVMATFGKAVGSYGAFCVGDKVLIDYLTNFARPFIFSTVFPQISAAFSLFVLKNYIFSSNTIQNKLLDLSEFARSELKGIKTLGSSYILPVVLGENDRAVRASEALSNNGYYCLAIRYPTVAKNSSRLRISLNASMEKEELEGLINQLKKL